MSEYQKYQHVEKLQSDEVEGILIGECYVFPKIDGTNGQVWHDDTGFHFGSRTRELSLDKDNAGFMAATLENKPVLELAKQLSGWRIFGEWLVPHSLKDYKPEAWRKFYIFDIYDTVNERYVDYSAWSPLAHKLGVDYIAPMKIIKNPSIENLLAELENNKYLLPDGYTGKGEGIVIKNYNYKNRFGRQTWAKIVTADFKSKHAKEMGAPRLANEFIEEKIAKEFLAVDVCEKVLANIKAECGWSSKLIPRLLNTVFYDFVRESTWDIIKAHNDPKIDFKLLRRFCFARTKELLPAVFE